MQQRLEIARVAAVLWIGALTPGFAEGPAAAPVQKQDDVRTLMELTGAARIGVETLSQTVAAFKQANPDVPEQFWRDFAARADAAQLTELIAPIYAKHLTPDEIRKLIEFYQSPVGRKLISVMPKIREESIAVGQEWGRRIAADIAARLEREEQKTPEAK